MMKNEDGEWERVASFTEYAMGKVGEILPDDAYRILPKDRLIQWDVHYYPGGSAQGRTGAIVAKGQRRPGRLLVLRGRRDTELRAELGALPAPGRHPP